MRDLTPNADSRVERSKAKVLEETYRQMVRNGFGGVSIDEISRQSGISKTTIYRHWPSRSALLVDACSRLGAAQEVPDTGRSVDDMRILLTYLADQLQTAAWSSVYPSILDASERDPEIRAMQEALHRGFMTPFETVIARAGERGELRSGEAPGDQVAALVGPLFYRRWFSKEKIDQRFIESLAQKVFR